MDMLSDVALLSRIQFALTVAYHFIFVPLSIGLGLILAIFATKYHRSRSEADGNAMRFWVRIFTATFAIGVATGITMEFSFGTNWADYSRFVGDIFGAPLAAEALFAFFLESVFLGVLLFGRNKVSSLFYTVSAWLVWAGSCLSALWILIANSWMQTPAGAELAADGSKAVITDFLAAAFNPSTLPRYTHVVVALLILGIGTLRWHACIYYFDEVTIRSRSGILLQRVTEIPLERIASTVEEHPFYLRPLRAACLRISTAAGAMPDADMQLTLYLRDLHRLRQKR